MMNTEPLQHSLPTENGYYPLQPGKLAALTIYYERFGPFVADAPRWSDDISVERLGSDQMADYRTLFRRVGERWLWVSRLDMSDAELATLLANHDIEVLGLRRGDEWIGMLEIDFSTKNEAEIVYIGLIEGVTGAGIGRAMVNHVVMRASKRATQRIWLHTCHFDSAQASKFYEACGFSAYHLAVEIMDDPRLKGQLPSHAAPHVPLITPASVKRGYERPL